MAKSELRADPGDGARVGKGRPRQEPAADDRFPPLSISIESFLKDGSDREFRHLIYSLFSFSALMTRHREYYASYIGVTGAQYSMIASIAETSRATIGQIAEHMRVSSPFVTTEISNLIRKNIVEKRPNENDRRSMYLGLTPKGQNLLRELGPIRRESNDLMYGSLTGERARALQEIIDALIRDANSALHALDAPHARGKKAPSVRSEGRSGRGQSGRRRAP